MKKLKTIALVFISCLLLTGCGCAKKSKSYTVTFDSNGGSSIIEQTVKDGNTATRPSDPTKEGYIFDGWYLDDNEYNFNDEVTENIKLIAKWKASGEAYTVTFDSNGGDSVESISITEDGSFTLPTPTRSGYTFLGWYDGDTKITETSKITADMTLTARWEKEDTEEPTTPSTPTTPSNPTTNEPTKPANTTPRNSGSSSSSTNKPSNSSTTPSTPSTPSNPTTPVDTTVSVSSVSVSETSASLTVGDTKSLSAQVNPSNATNKTVTWTSSNPAVATVDANGNVKAVGAGSATITATAGGKSATCTVTVTAKVTYSIQGGAMDTTGQQYVYIVGSDGNRYDGSISYTTTGGKNKTLSVSKTDGVLVMISTVQGGLSGITITSPTA